MSNTKLERIETEIEKTKAKIAEFQSKLRELERRRTEEINLQIVQIVHAESLTPQELAKFLAKRKSVFEYPNGIDNKSYNKNNIESENE